MLRSLVYLVVLTATCECKNTIDKDPQDTENSPNTPEWQEEIREVTGHRYSPRTLFLVDPTKNFSQMKPVAGCTVTTPSPKDKEEIINFHNRIRRRAAKGLEDRAYNGTTLPKAKNMIAVGYSDFIEKMASTWASQCNEHFKDHFITDDYERIWQSLIHTSGHRPIPLFDFRLAAEYRYNKSVRKFYGPDAVKPFSGRNSQTGEDVQSYSAMIQAGVRSIGCVQAMFFNNTEKMHHQFIICNYAGSFKRNTPLYIEGEPCSDVPPYYCDNGLVTIKDSNSNQQQRS